MKKIITLTLLFALAAIYNNVIAQDLLFLKGQKQPLKVKVIELGLDEIKYKTWPVTEDAVVMVIEKTAVEKIIMQSGDVYEFKGTTDIAAPNFDEQKKQAVKFKLLSPIMNNLSFSYERLIKKGSSYEIGLVIPGVGLNWDEFESTRGVILRGGYKFMNTPDYYVRGMRYAHVLKGGYVKPEIILGAYNRTYKNYYYGSQNTITEKIVCGAAVINLGKQWVFDNVFVVDWSFGLGYGFVNSSFNNSTILSDDFNPINYAFFGGIDEFPIAYTANFRIGFLIGQPKKTTK